MKGHCGECERRYFCEIDPGKCDEWTDPAPQTKADYIRAMSDEDLKDSILAVHHGYTPWCDYHCENKGDDGCDRCIEKWLKQPAEEA